MNTAFSSTPLLSFDPDAVVVDLDDVDEGLKVGLAERHRTDAEVFPHGPAKAFDQCGSISM